MESHVSATVTMPAGHAPTGRLALALQEAFTAVVRLREGRQVPSDSAAFRARMKDLLAGADQEARRMGYPPEFVKVAVYCAIAYLDETVMGTPGPLASAWVGQPLQEEIFGDHVAGETFFRHLEDLLSRQDSPFDDTAPRTEASCGATSGRPRTRSCASGEGGPCCHPGPFPHRTRASCAEATPGCGDCRSPSSGRRSR